MTTLYDPDSVVSVSEAALQARLAALEEILQADVLGLLGPIAFGAERKVRDALERLGKRRPRVVVVLHTAGGIVEVAERMVNIVRHLYSEVVFLIPDVAMSAGTVLAMSGDAIMMEYSSCLGPIDPQVEREGKLVPALSYLEQYQRLIRRAEAGNLTDAEFAILSRFDQAELHQFEMARDLSISLLSKWLTKYKFKDWTVSTSRGTAVTETYKECRAREIATSLMDSGRWGSHGRGIPMAVLRDELKLKIDDFGANNLLREHARGYFRLAVDYMTRNGVVHLAHSRQYL